MIDAVSSVLTYGDYKLKSHVDEHNAKGDRNDYYVIGACINFYIQEKNKRDNIPARIGEIIYTRQSAIVFVQKLSETNPIRMAVLIIFLL